MKEKAYELYKAVKWEVEHFQEDCGFSMIDMWDIVNFKGGIEAGMWWRDICLEDYRNRRV